MEFLNDPFCPCAVREQFVAVAISKNSRAGVVAIQNFAVCCCYVKSGEITFKDIAIFLLERHLIYQLFSDNPRLLPHPPAKD
jgi:hypothetical protein